MFIEIKLDNKNKIMPDKILEKNKIVMENLKTYLILLTLFSPLYKEINLSIPSSNPKQDNVTNNDKIIIVKENNPKISLPKCLAIIIL